MNYRENGKRAGKFSIEDLLKDEQNSQILFVGSLNCTRHRGFQMGKLMKEDRMAILTPSSADFSSGKYLKQIVDAIVELSNERNSREFTLMYGCQCALLSTDFDMIKEELKNDYDINLDIHLGCHLCMDEKTHGHGGEE